MSLNCESNLQWIRGEGLAALIQSDRYPNIEIRFRSVAPFVEGCCTASIAIPSDDDEKLNAI